MSNFIKPDVEPTFELPLGKDSTSDLLEITLVADELPRLPQDHWILAPTNCFHFDYIEPMAILSEDVRQLKRGFSFVAAASIPLIAEKLPEDHTIRILDEDACYFDPNFRSLPGLSLFFHIQAQFCP